MYILIRRRVENIVRDFEFISSRDLRIVYRFLERRRLEDREHADLLTSLLRFLIYEGISQRHESHFCLGVGLAVVP